VTRAPLGNPSSGGLVSPVPQSVLSVGRPSLPAILGVVTDEVIESVQRKGLARGAGIVVGACGPKALVRDVRGVVGAVQEGKAVAVCVLALVLALVFCASADAMSSSPAAAASSATPSRSAGDPLLALPPLDPSVLAGWPAFFRTTLLFPSAPRAVGRSRRRPSVVVACKQVLAAVPDLEQSERVW